MINVDKDQFFCSRIFRSSRVHRESASFGEHDDFLLENDLGTRSVARRRSVVNRQSGIDDLRHNQRCKIQGGGGARRSLNFWKKSQGARGYTILCFFCIFITTFFLIRPGWALCNNPLPPTLSSFLNFGTK